MPDSFNEETIVASIDQLAGLQQKKPAIDILGGPSMGQQILLEEGEGIWGRSQDAQVYIEDEAISRHHFKIKVHDKVATLEDLGSTNGTYVNGHRVKEYVLQPNDKIQISSVTVLRFAYVDPIDTDVHKRIYEMALYDPVTQAHTKRYFMDRLEHEFYHSRRRDLPLSLILFDLDHFKQINDTYGHPAGDFVLQQIGERSRSVIRREDLFARYGGEEFVILMRETIQNEAIALAERLRENIAAHEFRFEAKKIPVTASLGVACMTQGKLKHAKELIKQADTALYQAKASGRNCVRYYEPAVEK